ncbi:MAG TPA: ExeM/NucH family extracellular endonuclease, partial [Chromatiales bacterium]|nr:ExeM/NucH family extracellular endonuclease [Chromatiales bacterium]
MLPDLAAMSSTSFQITATTGAFPLEAGTIFTNTVEVNTTLLGDDPSNNVAETAATVFPLLYIHEIQGSGDSNTMPGAIVNIEAIVVGDFQDNDGDLFDTDLDGFYVQEELADYDNDKSTSEGLFVYAPGATDVAVGDLVCLTGEVGEYSDQTQLTLQGDLKICGHATLPAPVSLTLPVRDISDFERYEGMLVSFPQALVISEYYNYDRYNEVVLAEPFVDERPFQPSAYLDPTTEADAIDDAASLIARSRITLDDARSAQNPPLLRHPNGAPYALDNRFRGGDMVQDATGVLGQGFGIYRLQPTVAATYIEENPRPDASPAVGGSVQVGAFNVLNYFLTLDDGSDICGPNLDMECRGADTPQEFDRQRAKILAALEEIEADVFGLVELENTTGVTPTADLVAGLNDTLGAGTYAHIETGTIGGDAIKVGLIYKASTVTPLGDFVVLDDPAFLDPNNTGVPKNRAALVQTFQDNRSGETFTVVVNHLKSKGSDCGGAPDDDPVQGNCNLTRAMAADYLVDWLSTNPTGTGTGNNLIIGDLNAYDK